MTPLMFLPRVVKTVTTARATRAAATAYSESSRPDSSRRKLLIIFVLLLFLNVGSGLGSRPAPRTLHSERARRQGHLSIFTSRDAGPMLFSPRNDARRLRRRAQAFPTARRARLARPRRRLRRRTREGGSSLSSP